MSISKECTELSVIGHIDARQLSFTSFVYGFEKLLTKLAPASADTLTQLKVAKCYFDDLSIQEICKFSNIETLELCQIETDVDTIVDLDMDLPKSLDKLSTLTLRFVERYDYFTSDILEKLCSFDALEILTIHSGHFNVETMEYLSQCENLRELYLNENHYSVDNFDWNLMCNLLNLNKVQITESCTTITGNWLLHLTSSFDTLTYLSIANVNNIGLRDGICAYPNIQQLRMDCIFESISSDALALIKYNLKKLMELTLNFECSG